MNGITNVLPKEFEERCITVRAVLLGLTETEGDPMCGHIKICVEVDMLLRCIARTEKRQRLL